jgi:HlyD family secretion protein
MYSQQLSAMVSRLVCQVMLVSLAGLCAACSMLENNSSAEKPVEAAPVKAVVALGRIEPEGEVIKLSVSNAQDSRVNQILVKEGDFVKANQVIAILQGIDRRQADLRDAEADVRLRQAELQKVQQGDAKQAQLAAQQAVITRLQAQLQTQTVQRRAAIASTEATLHNAKQTYQRRQILVREGALKRDELDSAQRDFATNQAELATRQAELDQTVKTLQAEIMQEQARLKELQEVRPVDVEIARAQLEKAKISVTQRKALLEDAEVRVPIAGQILRINTRIGEQVSTSQGIVELAQTDRMFATAEVSETDIPKVRRGQRAIITSEYGGFAGEIKGTVEQISLRIGKKTLQDATTSNSPTTDQNARVFMVRVRIDKVDNPKVAALTDIQVRVRLETADKIPPKADINRIHLLPAIAYDRIAVVIHK